MAIEENDRGRLVRNFQAGAGLLFVASAIISVFSAIFFIVQQALDPEVDGRSISQPGEGFTDLLARILQENHEATFLVLTSMVAALIGGMLLRAAAYGSKQIIPDEDRGLLEPLISAKDEDAISQYVRISSLTGTTGTFTKLGFTGLPLVTAALGVLFVFLAIFTTKETSSELMDLGKLVIGAFIGSFVQRRVDRISKGDPLPEDTL